MAKQNCKIQSRIDHKLCQNGGIMGLPQTTIKLVLALNSSTNLCQISYGNCRNYAIVPKHLCTECMQMNVQRFCEHVQMKLDCILLCKNYSICEKIVFSATEAKWLTQAMSMYWGVRSILPKTLHKAFFPGGVPPPPSYDSIFGKAKQMREESSGPVDFLKKLLCFCMGSSK